MNKEKLKQVSQDYLSPLEGEGAVVGVSHTNAGEGLAKLLRFQAARKRAAFTLAEVLITLGIIGVVAAVSMPVLVANINERVQKEQVRTAKYKLTLATDKMKSLGLLGEQYPTTQAFVTELSKHLKLAKICDNGHLRDCWPTDEINLADGTTEDVSTLTNGTKLQALAIGTASTQSMGIVTADGTPMILVYSPNCTALDAERTYSWSMIDNKPETNTTTNCISAIMDINGGKQPNRIGKDVRTWNSLFGSVNTAYTDYSPLTYADCQKYKDKLGINECYKDDTGERDDDYWGGAVKHCHDLGLHLPSTQTLAMIAGARYGRSDITPYTVISSVQFAKTAWGNQGDKSCEQIWRDNGWSGVDKIICIDNATNQNMNNDDSNSSIGSFTGNFWSTYEYSASVIFNRNITDSNSNMGNAPRNYPRLKALCIGD